MSEYVRGNTDDLIIATLLNDMRMVMHHPDTTLDDIIEQLERWTDEDRKMTPL